MMNEGNETSNDEETQEIQKGDELIITVNSIEEWYFTTQ